jgi:hypothetical protein
VKQIFLALVVAIVFVTTSPAQTPKAERSRSGEIKGRIQDVTGAVVAGAKVVIEGKDFRREVLSNNDGYYHATLPTGKYKVGIPEGGGWHASGRKTIVIKHKTALHNIVLKGVRMDPEHP